MERNHITQIGYDHMARNHIKPTGYNQNSTRWERIIECNDQKKTWHAINWKGQYDDRNVCEDKPSDKEFKTHLEKLLNPAPTNNLTYNVDNVPFVPILDKPLQITELDHVIEKQNKPDKGCGPDGNSPGVFKFLPFSWIVFLLSLLNLIFTSTYHTAGLYHVSVCYSRKVVQAILTIIEASV